MQRLLVSSLFRKEIGLSTFSSSSSSSGRFRSLSSSLSSSLFSPSPSPSPSLPSFLFSKLHSPTSLSPAFTSSPSLLSSTLSLPSFSSLSSHRSFSTQFSTTPSSSSSSFSPSPSSSRATSSGEHEEEERNKHKDKWRRRRVWVFRIGGVLLLITGGLTAAGGHYITDPSRFDPKEPRASFFTQPLAFLKSCWRFVCCALVGVLIAHDYRTVMNRNLKGEEKQEEMSKVHKRSAERMLRLFRHLQGVYIKAGQHMACLDYLLPKEYTETMRPCQDQAPHRPFEDIEAVFLEQFGKKPDELFEEFQHTPVASASLAQVHRGKLHGKDIAVKVQFPGLYQMCISDVNTIDVIIKAIAKAFPEFQFKWLVDEFNTNLPLELDFTHEAKNSERTAKNFEGVKSFKTPSIYWEYTTPRVLTMEFVEGVKVNDLEGLKRMRISPTEVATIMTNIFSQQIHIHGFVHCDPHPGNVLVRLNPNSEKSSGSGDPQLVLLDHGLYREIDDELRENYSRLWIAVITDDIEAIEKYSKKFTPDFPYQLFVSMLTARDWDAVHQRGGLRQGLTPEEKSVIQQEIQRYVCDIAQILATVPSALLLLFKTNDVLRSVNHELGSPINEFTLMLRHCVAGVLDCVQKQSPGWWPVLKTKIWARYLLFRIAIIEKVMSWRGIRL